MLADALSRSVFYVYGLGISGIAVIDFLQKMNSKYFFYDDKYRNSAVDLPKDLDRPKLLSPHEIRWQEIDYLILAPGIQILKGSEHEVYKLAKLHNVQVICDLDLFYMSNPSATYIGITGTNGKSTTTALTFEILKEAGVKCHMGGNIGISVMNLPIEHDAIYVFEVSSFQLELASKILFNASVITNITPDHLDRHGTTEHYINVKKDVFRKQKSLGGKFFSIDYPTTYDIKSEFYDAITVSGKNKQDVYFKNRKLYDARRNKSFDFSNTKALLGDHNMENIAFAYCIANYCKVKDEIILSAINKFQGLKHRMQKVAEIENLVFINDSKATNQESAEKALLSFDDIIWIVGGVAKAGAIENLYPYSNKIVKAFVIGKTELQFEHILSSWNVQYDYAKTLENAIFKIKQEFLGLARKYTVLLSPAAASTDQFKNFEARGDAFIDLIKYFYAK